MGAVSSDFYQKAVLAAGAKRFGITGSEKIAVIALDNAEKCFIFFSALLLEPYQVATRRNRHDKAVRIICFIKGKAACDEISFIIFNDAPRDFL